MADLLGREIEAASQPGNEKETRMIRPPDHPEEKVTAGTVLHRLFHLLQHLFPILFAETEINPGIEHPFLFLSVEG